MYLCGGVYKNNFFFIFQFKYYGMKKGVFILFKITTATSQLNFIKLNC